MRETPQAIVKLVARLRELHEQEALIVAELDNLVQGHEGLGPRLKRLREYFSEQWALRYHTPYVFNFAKDTARLKRIVLQHGDAVIQQRMAVYIRSDDHFYVQHRHPFGVFLSQFNSFAPAPSSLDQGFLCQHTPRCDSEAEHTQRRLAEFAIT